MGWEIWLLVPDLVRLGQTSLLPWRGTAQQWNAALLLTLVMVFAGVVFGIWQRHGVAGVVQWWRQRQDTQRAYRQSEKGHTMARWSLFFWISVVLVLVVLFDASHGHAAP